VIDACSYFYLCKQQKNRVAPSGETQMSEFASKFEKDSSMVFFLSTNTVPRNAWYVESGASRHMTSSQELFSSLTKQEFESSG